MSVANGLVDSSEWVDQSQFRHNRSDPFAAMTQRLPLWFAATCLVGALCQPDVQATVRQVEEIAAAVVDRETAGRNADHDPGSTSPIVAGLMPAPRIDPASAAVVDRVVEAMAAGKTGPGVPPAAKAPAGPTPGALVARVERPDAIREATREPKPAAREAAPRDGPEPAPRGARETATVAPTLMPGGRLADSLVPPAQRALVKHISSNWRVDDNQIQRYVAKVWRTAGELELDPFLVLAVMATESSFNHKAQSARGAQGLMQVHTRVHRDKFKAHGGSARAFDPDASIKVGSQILKQYLDRYGSPRGALKAYVGAANLKSDGGYANKVLKRQAEFKQVVRTELTRLSAAGKLKVKAKDATRVASTSSFSPEPASR